jgi:hypothetical protein
MSVDKSSAGLGHDGYTHTDRESTVHCKGTPGSVLGVGRGPGWGSTGYMNPSGGCRCLGGQSRAESVPIASFLVAEDPLSFNAPTLTTARREHPKS